MSKLVKKVSQVFGHHTGGDAARAAAAGQVFQGSEQFTGIDPNAPPDTSRGRKVGRITGLRIPLGAPSTPLGPRRTPTRTPSR